MATGRFAPVLDAEWQCLRSPPPPPQVPTPALAATIRNPESPEFVCACREGRSGGSTMNMRREAGRGAGHHTAAGPLPCALNDYWAAFMMMVSGTHGCSSLAEGLLNTRLQNGCQVKEPPPPPPNTKQVAPSPILATNRLHHTTRKNRTTTKQSRKENLVSSGL